MKRLVLIMVAACMFVGIAHAQGQESVAGRQTEMKKLDKLVGSWKGSGWFERQGKRETFTGSEVVQRKIDGLVVLIEGKHLNPEGKVIHETLGVLSYDDATKVYKFATYLASGPTGTYDLKVVPEGYEWGFQLPSGGTIRYLIKADNDVWLETGEFSRDGKAWTKFFEMKLDRAK